MEIVAYSNGSFSVSSCITMFRNFTFVNKHYCCPFFILLWQIFFHSIFYKSASKLINMIGVVNGDKYITWLSSHLLRNMSEEEIFQHDEITSDTSLATNKFLTGRHRDKLSLPKPLTSIPDRG